jgi:hypothetical protein
MTPDQTLIAEALRRERNEILNAPSALAPPNNLCAAYHVGRHESWRRIRNKLQHMLADADETFNETAFFKASGGK